MIVLDAAALLAYLQGNPQGEAVAAHLEDGAIISHLSFLEVAKSLPEVPVNRLFAVLEQTGIGLRSIEERHLNSMIKALRTGQSLEQASAAVLARVTGFDPFMFQPPSLPTPPQPSIPTISSTSGGTDAVPN
jgi:predicted nucleic acid-binding protein